MTKYQYVRLRVYPGDLSQLNRYGEDGWKAVATDPSKDDAVYVLLMREVPNA